MAILRFLADIESRDLVLSSGLARSFSRDLTTIDPDGTFVDSNDLRFDETVLVAAVPAADEALFTGPNGYVLAAGVGANGSTELLLYLNTSNAKLSLFTGTSTTSADTTLYLRNAGTSSAAAGDDQFLDMFNNGSSLGAKGLQPRCAVRCASSAGSSTPRAV